MLKELLPCSGILSFKDFPPNSEAASSHLLWVDTGFLSLAAD